MSTNTLRSLAAKPLRKGFPSPPPLPVLGTLHPHTSPELHPGHSGITDRGPHKLLGFKHKQGLEGGELLVQMAPRAKNHTLDSDLSASGRRWLRVGAAWGRTARPKRWPGPPWASLSPYPRGFLATENTTPHPSPQTCSQKARLALAGPGTQAPGAQDPRVVRRPWQGLGRAGGQSQPSRPDRGRRDSSSAGFKPPRHLCLRRGHPPTQAPAAGSM